MLTGRPMKLRKNASLRAVALEARKRARVLYRVWRHWANTMHEHGSGPNNDYSLRRSLAWEHYNDAKDVAEHLARLAKLPKEEE